MLSSHQRSEELLVTSFPSFCFKSVNVLVDGNCLPRPGCFILTGNEDLHLEMRVRIVHELLQHDDAYLNDSLLAQGKAAGSHKITSIYAQFSPGFVPGVKLGQDDLRDLYEKEVTNVIHAKAFCGM